MPSEEMFAGAAAYDRFVGRYGPSLAASFLEFAGIQRGTRALDIGCGTGALSAALAARLGVANVGAAEPSADFAAACRARVPGIEVAEAPAEALPFEDGAFDATVSQLVLNFLDDVEAGVGEMARVTREGGLVAACVWDYAGEMTLLRAFWDAAHAVTPDRAAANDEGRLMRPGSEDELVELWRGAGFASVRSAALSSSATYANFDDLWSPLPTGVGPAGAFCAALGDADRAALRDALRTRLGVGDEPFTLQARAWAVAGSRAGQASRPSARSHSSARRIPSSRSTRGS